MHCEPSGIQFHFLADIDAVSSSMQYLHECVMRYTP